MNNDILTDSSTQQRNITIPFEEATPSGDITSDFAVSLSYLVLDVIIAPSTLLLGICTNSLNLLVFHQMGLKDTVSIAFFSLSLSDLAYLLLHMSSFVGRAVLFAIDNAGAELTADSPKRVNFFFHFIMIWYASWCYDISVLIKVFISLQRCLCIALPFRFKSMFTRTKTILIITCIYVYVTMSYVPIFTTYSLLMVTLPATNSSILILQYDKDGSIKENIFYWMNRILLQFISQILIFLNVLILSSCLARSSRFRKTVNARISVDHGMPLSLTKHFNKFLHRFKGTSKESQKSNTKNNFETSSKLSGKELQAVKSVSLVAFLFLLTNLPSNILFCINRFVPGFYMGGTYNNSFLISYSTRTEIEVFNASANIFVYYHCNTKFKHVLKLLTAKCLCGKRVKPDPIETLK